MDDKVGQNTDNKEGGIVNVWEKRIVTIVLTFLIGYIATIAGGIQTQLKVMQNDNKHIVKLVDDHQSTLKIHDGDLRKQDNRLVQVESTLKAHIHIN